MILQKKCILSFDIANIITAHAILDTLWRGVEIEQLNFFDFSYLIFKYIFETILLGDYCGLALNSFFLCNLSMNTFSIVFDRQENHF